MTMQVMEPLIPDSKGKDLCNRIQTSRRQTCIYTKFVQSYDEDDMIITSKFRSSKFSGN